MFLLIITRFLYSAYPQLCSRTRRFASLFSPVNYPSAVYIRKLQRVLRTAAKIVTRTPKFQPITPVCMGKEPTTTVGSLVWAALASDCCSSGIQDIDLDIQLRRCTVWRPALRDLLHQRQPQYRAFIYVPLERGGGLD